MAVQEYQPIRSDSVQLADASPQGGMLAPGALPHKGERYRIRLKLFGHFDMNMVDTLTGLIRAGENVQHFFSIIGFEAMSDDNSASLIPRSSGQLENWSLYVTAEYVGPENPSFATSGPNRSAAQFDPITLTVCVGAILALLGTVILVTGWTAEKLGKEADHLAAPFLALFVLGAAYFLTKAA